MSRQIKNVSSSFIIYFFSRGGGRIFYAYTLFYNMKLGEFLCRDYLEVNRCFFHTIRIVGCPDPVCENIADLTGFLPILRYLKYCDIMMMTMYKIVNTPITDAYFKKSILLKTHQIFYLLYNISLISKQV